jgi:hypothetical protein
MEPMQSNLERQLREREETIAELEAQRDQLRTALGNLVARIAAESMIPAGTLSRWQRDLQPAQDALRAAGWYGYE